MFDHAMRSMSMFGYAYFSSNLYQTQRLKWLIRNLIIRQHISHTMCGMVRTYLLDMQSGLVKALAQDEADDGTGVVQDASAKRPSAAANQGYTVTRATGHQ